MKKLLFIIPAAILILTACPFPGGYKYNTGHFTETLVNFEAVNTEYDDYNSAAPFIWYHYLFHFSSNRNSQGGEFDIVGENMKIYWNKDDGSLDIGTVPTKDEFDYLYPMFDSANTSSNELGPYSIGYRTEVSSSETIWTDLMLFASDSGGDFDISFISAELHRPGNSDQESELKQVQKAGLLNTDANELYPCFAGESFYFNDEWGLDPADIEQIIYCTDAGGDFDIVEMEFNPGGPLTEALLAEQAGTPRPIAELNSASDDKCPFVVGEFMIFASDRDGGYGGFDLYYSWWDGEKWGEPENLGEEINSSSDEYRPILLSYWDFDNSLLIFSSNREGGLGGFDLYYIGVDTEILH